MKRSPSLISVFTSIPTAPCNSPKDSYAFHRGPAQQSTMSNPILHRDHQLRYLPQPQGPATKVVQMQRVFSSMGFYPHSCLIHGGLYQITLAPGPKWPPIHRDPKFRTWGPNPKW